MQPRKNDMRDVQREFSTLLSAFRNTTFIALNMCTRNGDSARLLTIVAAGDVGLTSTRDSVLRNVTEHDLEDVGLCRGRVLNRLSHRRFYRPVLRFLQRFRHKRYSPRAAFVRLLPCLYEYCGFNCCLGKRTAGFALDAAPALMCVKRSICTNGLIA